MGDQEYTSEEKESFYTHFMSIWSVLPESVRHKFLREQKCLLCDTCTFKLKEIQESVISERAAKYNTEK